jgi:hypothetical protein
LKKRFGEINQIAKQTWDHDHRQATILDIDKACTHVYRITLEMLKQINNTQMATIEAINRIEAHLGMEITKFVPDEPEQQVISTEENTEQE